MTIKEEEQEKLADEDKADGADSTKHNPWPSLKRSAGPTDKVHKSRKKRKRRSKVERAVQPQSPPQGPPQSKSQSQPQPNLSATVQALKSELERRPKAQPVLDSEMMLISKEVVPKHFLKVLRVKEAVKRGDALTLKDALEEFELDPKVFYKYRGKLLPFFEATGETVFTLLFTIEQEGNVLGKLVTLIGRHAGEILALNKSFPVSGISNVDISIETTNLDIELEELLGKLEQLRGVRTMELMGRTASTRVIRN